MKTILIIFLLMLLAVFQYQLWFSPDGITKTFSLKNAIAEQQLKNDATKKRNDDLKGDITALKKGNLAIERYAREDLGMIKKGETFYQVVK